MLSNESYFENNSVSDNDTTTERFAEATFIYSTVFILFIPYIVLLTLCYLARKTDDRQPQYALQCNLIACSFVCIIGTFIFSIISLMLQSSKTLVSGSTPSFLQLIHSFFAKVLLKLIVTCPHIVLITYFYFLLLIAFQRVFLIAKAKVGMQLLTGFTRLFNHSGIPWLKVFLLGFTVILFFIACLSLRHIERKMVATAHVIVIVQTAPLIFILIVFTTIEAMAGYVEQPVVGVQTLRIVTAFAVSIATPLSIILGSWTKRRVVWAILTCRWEEQHGRGELYTADRSPVEHSNAVSLSPSPTIRF